MRRTKSYDILPLNADNEPYRAFIEQQLREELLMELGEECVYATPEDIRLSSSRRRSLPGVRGPVLRVTASFQPPEKTPQESP